MIDTPDLPLPNDAIRKPSAFRARAMLLAAVLALPLAALAAQPFSTTEFRKAQAEGKPILVAVHAKWCTSCVRQIGVLAQLEEDRALKGLVRFDVDFDRPAGALELLGVQSQATLVVYNGRTEKGRSSFDTNPRSIRALVAKAFQAR